MHSTIPPMKHMQGTAGGELLFLILQLSWSSPLCVLWKSKGAAEVSGAQI